MGSDPKIINPNLLMARETMSGVPLQPAPDGFSARGMEQSDVPAWLSIWREVEPSDRIPDILFERNFGSDWALVRSRCFLLFAPSGEPAGTVSAWFDDSRNGLSWGRIHWVALRREFQGRGLGKALLSLGMERVKALGHERCYLVTQYWRHAAIRLYLGFGFEPELCDAASLVAWREACAGLGDAALSAFVESQAAALGLEA